MGKPCGCAGSCGCDIKGRNGVRVSGSGISPDTMWIELDGTSPGACNTIMDCVGANLGNGLTYNASLRKVLLKLSATAGNQASIGSDGGLYVTGSGGGGGSGGGQTVANLPTGVNTIIGSTWGAGSSLWPEGIRDSITAAGNKSSAVRMVHIPVRRTSDEYPICLAEQAMSWYMQDGNPYSVGEFEHREHAATLIAPGGTPTPSVEGGYFGFYQDVSKGSPTLADVFAALARRVVLVTEARDTSAPGSTIARVVGLSTQYECQASLIVAGEPVASGASTILEAVATAAAGTGIPIAAVFRTRQQVLDFPASRLATLGVTWVFMQQDLVDPVSPTYAAGAAEAYRTAGLNVMLTWVNRQYQAQFATALQLRGSLCTDPDYAYGSSSLWRYRRDIPTWNPFTTPNVGQHSPYADTVVGQQAHYRGFVIAGQPSRVTLRADLKPPGQAEPVPGGYFILPGEVLPMRNASTYAIQCWFRWDGSLPADRTRWAGIVFDCPTDRPFKDWGTATAQSIGFQLMLSTDNKFSLVEYDGTPGSPTGARLLGTWNVGYNIAANFWYGMRVEVTPTAIRIYASTNSFPDPFNKLLIATINNPHRYITGANQGYFFFGRQYQFLSDSRDNQVAGLAVQYSGF